jgi:hypothetical protein
MSEAVHYETLEEEANHVIAESRMVLPGVQTILGFQLMAVFNQRFELFSRNEQILHFTAFFLTAAAMGLIMAPAAYHRQAERRWVSRRFVSTASRLLTISMVPFLTGICLDTFLVGRLIFDSRETSIMATMVLFLFLAGIWFGLPFLVRNRPVRR